MNIYKTTQPPEKLTFNEWMIYIFKLISLKNMKEVIQKNVLFLKIQYNKKKKKIIKEI